MSFTDQASLTELEASAILSNSSEILTSDIYVKHSKDPKIEIGLDGILSVNVLNVLQQKFLDNQGIVTQVNIIRQRISQGLLRSVRQVELEALQAGKVRLVNPDAANFH